MLRLAVQKYKEKFLMSVDSYIEISTTIPFFICMPAFGIESVAFQFFVMIDQTRLFLYQRYTKYIVNDVTREQLQITMSVTLMTWVMSFFLQFWENMYNYNKGDWAMIEHYYDIFFFMMTTLSTVGYGSTVQSDISKTSIIVFIVACVVIIPG